MVECPNEEKNKDPMEVETLNTRSGWRYIGDDDERAQAADDPMVIGSPPRKETQPFEYDFVDHLSWVLVKISLLDLLRLDKKRREMVAKVLAVMNKEEETDGRPALQAIAEVTEMAKVLECLLIQARRGVPLTFTKEDMLIGDMKHSRSLYFTGYIREVEV